MYHGLGSTSALVHTGESKLWSLSWMLHGSNMLLTGSLCHCYDINTIDSHDDISRGWITVQASHEPNLRFSHGCCSAEHKANVGSNAKVDDNTVQMKDIDLESN